MPNPISDIRAAVESVVATTWPDAEDVFRVLDAERMNWLKLLKAYDDGEVNGIKAPWATVQTLPTMPADFGLNTDSRYLPFRCWYIVSLAEDDGSAKDSFDVHAELDQALYDLGRAVWARNDFAVVDTPQLDSSDGNEANRYILAANLPLMAGYVSFAVLFGSTL